jgi:hypothetical protein
MPRFGWMGTLREPSRRATFSFLKQALSTDDGRAILAESLTGQLASPSQIDVNAEVLSEAPYLELGTPSVRRQLAAPPVFITARFRSGSTLLWNIFRNVERCTAYYEPLNERRWFDPAARGNRVDATHVGVSDYWREYEGLSNLATLYQAHWIERHLFMGPQFWDPNLFKYIRTLIDAAPHQAVLQFNRVDFRLPWLRRTFPEARVVHLYRHPRDQWCSSLVDVTSFSPAGTARPLLPAPMGTGSPIPLSVRLFRSRRASVPDVLLHLEALLSLRPPVRAHVVLFRGPRRQARCRIGQTHGSRFCGRLLPDRAEGGRGTTTYRQMEEIRGRCVVQAPRSAL